jgi:hypothetical protein
MAREWFEKAPKDEEDITFWEERLILRLLRAEAEDRP